MGGMGVDLTIGDTGESALLDLYNLLGMAPPNDLQGLNSSFSAAVSASVGSVSSLNGKVLTDLDAGQCSDFTD